MDGIDSLECFDHLPGANFSSSVVPVTGSISTSSGSVVHPIALGSDGRTSTSSVVLRSSGRHVVTSTSSGVGAATGTVAELTTETALNLRPVLRLGALLGEVALLLAIAAGNIVLSVVSMG